MSQGDGETDSIGEAQLHSLMVVGNRSKAKLVIDQLVSVMSAVIGARNSAAGKRSSHNSVRKVGQEMMMISFQLDPPCLRCTEMQHMVPSSVTALRHKLELEMECGLALDYSAQRGFALRYKPLVLDRCSPFTPKAQTDDSVLVVTEDIAVQSALTRLM